MRQIQLIVIVVFMLVVASTAQAVHWNPVFKVCALLDSRFIDPLPRLSESLPIPVGCELPGCCPGCPPLPLIDWEVVINGELVKSAELRFENLNTSQLRRLELKGSAKRLDEQTFLLQPGTTLIQGLPRDPPGKVPVAFIRAVSATARDQTAGYSGGTASEAEEGIRIVQYVQKYEVNSFAVKIAILACEVPDPLDRVVLDGKIDSDPSVILMDFNAGAGNGGCTNDRIAQTQHQYSPGNALSTGTCQEADIAVFSAENAMSYERPVSTWTNQDNDTHTVSLEPVVIAPVEVWIGHDDLADDAMDDFNDSNVLFEQNRTGIKFEPTFHDFSSDIQKMVDIIGIGCPGSDVVKSDYLGESWYSADKLNVYYLPWDFTGRSCQKDRNLVQMGKLAIHATLAHEFGHAFGMHPVVKGGHVNDNTAFGTENIMFAMGVGSSTSGSTSVTRTKFTIGQSFRLNTHTESMLNVNGVRNGIEVFCTPDQADSTCPVLHLDFP